MAARPEGDHRAALERPGPWSKASACLGRDPAIWYPAPGDLDAVELAKRLCRTCPVQHACLEYALANRELFGVWGGVGEEDRRLILLTASVMEDQGVMKDPGADPKGTS